MKRKMFLIIIIFLININFKNIFAYEVKIAGKDISIHAVLSQGYLKSDNNNFLADTIDGTFQFNEFGVNLYTDLTDRIFMAAQLLSRDYGSFGNNDIVLDWAYINYIHNSFLNFKIGKINIAYGLHNETRNIDMLRNYVLLPQSVYNESWRDTQSAIEGISLTGSVFTDNFGIFSYTLSYCQEPNIDKNSGITEYINSQVRINIYDYELSNANNYALKWETPIDGLFFNVTRNDWSQKGLAKVDSNTSIWQYYNQILSNQLGFNVKIEDFVHDLDIESTVYSMQYIINNLTFTFEYCNIELTKSRYAVRNILPSEIELSNKSQDLIGYYFAIDYAFNDAFKGALIYSEYYPDYDDKDGKKMISIGQPSSNASLKDITVCLRYNFKENWLVKFECHFMDGTAIMNMKDNLDSDGEIDVEKDWILFTSKLTYNF